MCSSDLVPAGVLRDGKPHTNTHQCAHDKHTHMRVTHTHTHVFCRDMQEHTHHTRVHARTAPTRVFTGIRNNTHTHTHTPHSCSADDKSRGASLSFTDWRPQLRRREIRSGCHLHINELRNLKGEGLSKS